MQYVKEQTEEIRENKIGNTDDLKNGLIYLLRIEKEDNSHNIYIKTVDRFLNAHTCNKDKRYCPACSQKIRLPSYKFEENTERLCYIMHNIYS